MSLEQIYLRTLEMESPQEPGAEFDERFLDYLSWLGKTTEKSGSLSELGMASDERISLYTRMANCVITWVCSTNEAPSLEVIQLLAIKKTLIWSIFQASAYGSQSILTERIAEYEFNREGEDLKLANSSIGSGYLMRLLAVISVNDANEAIIHTALTQDAETGFALWLGWTAERIRVTDRALNAESLLLAFTENREPIVIPKELRAAATCAYMYFTYMIHERKHDMKAYLNRCFAKTLDAIGLIVPELPEDRVTRDKPKMVIPLERFVSGHAMHRCYAEYIAWLSEEFETIALANSKDIDEQSGAIFSRVIHKEPNWTIQDVVNIVAMESPDIIYFPSIGMSTWTILMSNIRLAPVQVMTAGHPATSTSPEIDYIVRPHYDGRLQEQNFYTEKVLYTSPNNSTDPWSPFLPNVRDGALPSSKFEIEFEDNVRIIGVNAKIMKLNSVFLRTLREIRLRCLDRSESDIRYHFYPAEKGIGFDGITKFLETLLIEVNVMPYLTYGKFLDSLSDIHLSLVPFPFGNTNSSIDSISLKKPTIFLADAFVTMIPDSIVADRLCATGLMAAKDWDDYVDRAVSAINSPMARIEWSDFFSRIDMYAVLEDGDQHTEAFSASFVQTLRRLIA